MKQPDELERISDQTRADAALPRLRAGVTLVYRGDYRGLVQLYAALRRRLARARAASNERRARKASSLGELFHRERTLRHEEHRVLAGLVVEVGPFYTLELAHAPSIVEACSAAWGPPGEVARIVGYRELLGVIGARQWQERGIFVPALSGRIHPRYGVFPPTQLEYVELVAEALSADGHRTFDVGTGTGVLALVAARQGARHVVATDVDPRAVECARDNARRFGLESIVEVELCDLFPQGAVGRVLFNPPWMPGTPRTDLERGVFDPKGALLERFMAALGDHLNDRSEGLLVLGDLAERLGLRAPDQVERLAARGGLRIVRTHSRTRRPPPERAEPEPLRAARAAEHIRLFRLARA